ncbi:pleckstrin homology (PH) domain-containing protein isoform X2 [Wolffia australiana]
MLEDQVASLLQKYLGNYVKGFNKEALKISVWRGDVELKNMQLKPEALNALKLPVKVKAGFLGSIRIKVPWSRLGQEPVIVHVDRILILAEPATRVEGSNEDAIQEAKRARVQEMEARLLENRQLQKSEMTSSWLGSFINTIIGNLKLSISNIHIRYEDLESNPGHPFAAGLMLGRLSAFTIDDAGEETFATGEALDHIQKSVELARLAFYLDSDISPWSIDKKWEDLLPSEWSQIFELDPIDDYSVKKSGDHCYFLQPVTGNARYTKLRTEESRIRAMPLQKASINLEDVTLCLSEDGYTDILRLSDNFTAFNQRLKYAHYRPHDSISSDPRSWWKYAFKVVAEEANTSRGVVSWNQVLRHAKLRKRYVSLYASLLRYSGSWDLAHENEDLRRLDRELDIYVILQWRMLAHEFVVQSTGSAVYQKKQKTSQSWWSLGWAGSNKGGRGESDGIMNFSDEDWERLNKVIGYKESDDNTLISKEDNSVLQLDLEFYMKHNSSKLVKSDSSYLADLSCDNLECSAKFYSETKIFNLNLGSYKLSSQNGLLAESATTSGSLLSVFSYKPFGSEMDWSFVAKASPCYMTYLKDTIDDIISFFKNSTGLSQTLALETAAAVQMTLDEVRRTAQQQFTTVLREKTRFLLDLDIAAPKIMIPAESLLEDNYTTRLLLDLGHLKLLTQEEDELSSSEYGNLIFQLNVVLSDVSAFMVDGEFSWTHAPNLVINSNNILPVIDKCGAVVKLQQLQLQSSLSQGIRLAVHLPVLGFHFSPARYHRLMKILEIFQDDNASPMDMIHPWNEAEFGGWLPVLSWRGVGNREATWQQRYLCIAGQFLYVLEYPTSKTYKQCISLRGKQVHQIPPEMVANVEHVLVLCDAGPFSVKVVEDASAVILHCGTDESCDIWQSRIQGAIYRTSVPAVVSGLSDAQPSGVPKQKQIEEGISLSNMEKLFITGVLGELKIRFDYKDDINKNFEAVLLGKESGLIELRAIGGQVEVSIRENDLFVGTILKLLEVEDLYQREEFSNPRYLAKSFMTNIGECPRRSSSVTTYDSDHKSSSSEQTEVDAEEQFYEASDSLSDFLEANIVPRGDIFSEYVSSKSHFLSFKRTPGLLPDLGRSDRSGLEEPAAVDSFVKAQIVIFDQGSYLYSNIDKKVTLRIGLLSFFCQRPTILAIMGFISDINAEDVKGAHQSDAAANDISIPNELHHPSKFGSSEEAIIKGLLGKGKSRVIFYLKLNMARAQIFLMNENGDSLATLSQNNLLVDIKVFPSSFQIKAAVGNLKISDDSLSREHSYFWVCDMRNPDGSSFVKLEFDSYGAEDEDYPGYEYSLSGELSEIRVVYLNRFIEEMLGYFNGLGSTDSEGFVRLKDKVSDTEKWFTTAEIQGSPALKLDLSLNRPIILIPRRTDSPDYLQLDVPEIVVQNTFQWFEGAVNDINAVRLEILTIKVKDINLTVGTEKFLGESIIQDVKGLSIVIQRSLRDLLHQIPVTEISLKVLEISASLSNKEYELVTECAIANMSETPNLVAPLTIPSQAATMTEDGSGMSIASEPVNGNAAEKAWEKLKLMVSIGLIGLNLHTGATRDSSLATIQAREAWILYRSDSYGKASLSSTLLDFSIIDNREGTRPEFRLAVGKQNNVTEKLLTSEIDCKVDDFQKTEMNSDMNRKSVLAMLILDVKFEESSTAVSLCIQRPHLLVALDFLLAVVEFFVPAVHNMLCDEGDKDYFRFMESIIPDEQVYRQPFQKFSLSPIKPFVIDSEKFEHLIYDGRGGKLSLVDRVGNQLSDRSSEPIIFVGDGKSLQFRNVHIENGKFLDSCIYLGAHSSYSASKDDGVILESEDEDVVLQNPQHMLTRVKSSKVQPVESARTVYIIELQATSPELTFYSTSDAMKGSVFFSTKLLHAQFDSFFRVCIMEQSMELLGDVSGLTLESNGIRVLEPFDIRVKFSNSSKKTKLHASTSGVYLNLPLGTLKLFLSIHDDILEFLRMTTNKFTVVCSQFDKVGHIQAFPSEQTYAFWRPRAPPGFAVLGDCLTPLNEPPSKGIIAVNVSLAKVKRPVSFRLIWPRPEMDNIQEDRGNIVSGGSSLQNPIEVTENGYSLWFPVAPVGYVAVGCVMSRGTVEPSISSALCISSAFVSSCPLKDCISLQLYEPYSEVLSLWRVDNSFGSVLPADPNSTISREKGYDLRRLCFGYPELISKTSVASDMESNFVLPEQTTEMEKDSLQTSGGFFNHVSNFRLLWWNQGIAPIKKISIWRPVVPEGMAFFGDIAISGYEPPNVCMVAHDIGDCTLLKPACGVQNIGRIRKDKGPTSVSFWLPQAPPGFVSLGCIVSKGKPKQEDISAYRCLRTDLVAAGTFTEESIWDSSDIDTMVETLSLWGVDNEARTFFARKGLKGPPKRLAFKFLGLSTSDSRDDAKIDFEIKTFSVAVYDDYAGLMVPLCNVFLSDVEFNLCQTIGVINSSSKFSLEARSYNDKIDSWEPLIEPVYGVVRYDDDRQGSDGSPQLRLATTGDLNVIVSISNMNMILQAYSSWNSLNNSEVSSKNVETSTQKGRSIVDIYCRRSYSIIPLNKLGQDVFIKYTEDQTSSSVIRMPSGDNKLVSVPVSKTLMDPHMQEKYIEHSRSTVSVIVVDAELSPCEGPISGLYAVSVRTIHKDHHDSSVQRSWLRTRGAASACISSPLDIVQWNEAFIFKVDDIEQCNVEFSVIDIGKDKPVGSLSVPLKEIALKVCHSSSLSWSDKILHWEEFSQEPKVSHLGAKSTKGRIRFCVLVQEKSGKLDRRKENRKDRNSLLQISPTRCGPWTTMRLNYAAPSACWRLGNDVIASEVTVLNGNTYVKIRSLVCVTNKTDFDIEICLKSKATAQDATLATEVEKDRDSTQASPLQVDDIFETQKFKTSIGWVPDSSLVPNLDQLINIVKEDSSPEMFSVDLPAGWEWIDRWHVDNASVSNSDGWIYAHDHEHLKWPESSGPSNSSNTVRQRRWVRHRRMSCISIVLPLKPGESLPIPLNCLAHHLSPYNFHLRPSDAIEYDWSKTLRKFGVSGNNGNDEFSDLCISNLIKSEELLCCMPTEGNSSDGHQTLWFCLSIQPSDIGKDINLDLIQDWNLVISSPLSITNFLPVPVKYSVHYEELNRKLSTRHQEMLSPGETSKIYKVDLRQAVYLSLFLRGWELMDGPALVSHSSRTPEKTLRLRNCFSRRFVSVILDQRHENSQMQSRLIRLYVPYWVSTARCPPLVYKFVDLSKGRDTKLFSGTTQGDEKLIFEVNEEEMQEGHTICGPLKIQRLGLCLSLGIPGREKFGQVKDLRPLSDMDGSLDLCAYDIDGNCFRVLISSKPCRYQAVPTKVLSIRPYMTFTNRVGKNIFIRFSSDDEKKVLNASDSRVSYVYSETQESEKLQVQMEDLEWSFPLEIIKEDTITLMLRACYGGQKLLRLEVRGFEEGSRFVIIFRPISYCPMRIENRVVEKVNIRQSTLGDDAWISLQPFSSTNFAWENPYGPTLVDICILKGTNLIGQNVSLENSGSCRNGLHEAGYDFDFIELRGMRIFRLVKIEKEFTDDLRGQCTNESTSRDIQSCVGREKSSSPMEIAIDLGVVGISLIDHKPRELLYLRLEKVFLSYSPSYNGGSSTRFKFIIGQLQMDNELPFTVMPVLLVPERTSDMCHPVIKMTIVMSNENADGTQVYPSVLIRATENYWRINVHEPIIWALVDFYNNIQMDRVSNVSNVTTADPEIRINKIDISEMRFKLSLETAPNQRPHGALGMWSPLLSAVGNAFKIQIRLRKVIHDNRFMRKSAISSAIVNRIKRDLIHNPLHLILSVDILGMTKSTLASLSKGFAELSTDVEFLQLRSKQVWSRRITSVSDGIFQGTEAFAQSVAYGVSGVVTKPVESAREHGILGLPQGFLRAILGVVVQPVSGILDFVSLTVDGINASFTRCLELLSNKSAPQRIRNPRAIRANGLITEYSEKEAIGQMILYLAETSRHFGCTDIFKEPSKFAWSDVYEDHFLLPHQRILLITNKRVLQLLCLDSARMDRRPCKIIWDVPWEEILALELAKAGFSKPSHFIIHLKSFRKAESFVRLVKCRVEFEDDQDPQAVQICSKIYKKWKALQHNKKTLTLRVPSSQRYVQFSWDESAIKSSRRRAKSLIKTRELMSSSYLTDERRFVKHIVNFQKIWSSEMELQPRCLMHHKQVPNSAIICSLWRPVCPEGYVSVGDIARAGTHPPTVAAVYKYKEGSFVEPVGYDLVWRNCAEDYTTPVSIWSPRAPEGFISPGCVAVAGFEEPKADAAFCVCRGLSEEAAFEEQSVWTAPDAYPWSCFIYSVQSEALQFVALRQPQEESSWIPMRVSEPSEESSSSSRESN